MRKAHSITLLDPWENGQALMFMQVRIKALRRETKGNTMYTRFSWSLLCFTLYFLYTEPSCFLKPNSNKFHIHLNTLRIEILQGKAAHLCLKYQGHDKVWLSSRASKSDKIKHEAPANSKSDSLPLYLNASMHIGNSLILKETVHP